MPKPPFIHAVSGPTTSSVHRFWSPHARWYHTPILREAVLIGYTSLFSLGVLLGLVWIGFAEQAERERKVSTKPTRRLDRINAAVSALFGGLLVARLVFVGLHPDYYQKHPPEVIAFWQGGLNASGGLVGALLGVTLFTWRDRRHLWSVLDDLALPSLILSLTIWIGSWLDGVAYGKRVPLNWGWLMNADPFGSQIARWPTQLVGVLLSLLAFLALFRAASHLPQGVTACLALSAIALILLIVGFFRADASVLLLGQRLDVLAPAALSIVGLSLTACRWLMGRKP
jgi:phosphatidylglycerol:prolipoprotein diacylglycerol transferase